MIYVTIETEDGELNKVALPTFMAVCGRCEGRGTHVNPSIDGNGLPEEWVNDDDFMDDYRGGRYDVVCEECGGQNVIEMVDEENCLPELLEIYFEEMQELQDYENERRMQY